MQPQNSADNGSPQPNYDFIYNDPPKKTSNSSFKLPGLPKPALILVGLVGVLLIVIIIAAIIPRGGLDKQTYVAIVGRSQEINRISTAVSPQTKNTDTLSMIATTQAALTSDNNTIINFLAKNNVKVGEKDLAVYRSSTTDSQMQSASQNGTLDSTYLAYLKDQLNKYQVDLLTAYKAGDKTTKQTLTGPFNSTTALLKSPQLSSN
jgi:hypothetical protein